MFQKYEKITPYPIINNNYTSLHFIVKYYILINSIQVYLALTKLNILTIFKNKLWAGALPK